MIEALEFHRDVLLHEVAAADPPATDSLCADKHVAASLLQKAIRRGEAQWALRAALRLLDIDHLRLWRRLSITLFEDIGLHDPSLAWKLFSARQHCARSDQSKAWSIVASVVQSMVQAPKSQAANNAMYLAMVDPDERGVVSRFADLQIGEIENRLESRELSIPQSIAVIAVLSGPKTAEQLQLTHHPDASPAYVRRAIAEMSIDRDLLDLVGLAAKDGIQILALYAALIASQGRLEAPTWPCSSDLMPPARLMGGLPSWVFDMYTRAGQHTLRSAVRFCPSVRVAMNQLQPQKVPRSNILGSVHFEYESACIAARIQRSHELEFLQRARFHASSPCSHASAELFDALCRDWGCFQICREKEVAAQQGATQPALGLECHKKSAIAAK